MKLWMSGEIYHDVYDASTRASMILLETVNRQFGRKKYGKGLKSWDVIPIILPKRIAQHYPEILKYEKRTKECEFRLQVNHATFKKASQAMQIEMLVVMLRRSLEFLRDTEINDFDFERFENDFNVAVLDIQA